MIVPELLMVAMLPVELIAIVSVAWIVPELVKVKELPWVPPNIEKKIKKPHWIEFL